MTLLKRPGFDRAVLWLLCLIGGIAVGVSGFSSESNHPTYLPPSLHYLDPSYLAGDWWLSAARHYHFAFFGLAVGLAKLGVLEAGLALLNVVTVAAAIFACYRMLALLMPRYSLAALAIFVAILLLSRTFFSAGNSYLFTPSLQPSSLAATGTLFAILALLERRLLLCGAWLAAAGLFHVNFLVANIPFFGLAYGLSALQERPWRTLLGRQSFADLARLLGPSLVVLTAFLSLILAVQGEALSAAEAKEADWIFFQFAVPFHYVPLNFLSQLAIFLCWQLLGLFWTARAIEDVSLRRTAWALQIALAVIIWTATALTGIVFIAPVSRLFLWRLAPFAMLLSVLITVIGLLRVIVGEREEDKGRRDGIIILESLAAVPALLMPSGLLAGQLLPSFGLAPAGILMALLLLIAALCHWTAFRWQVSTLPTKILLVGVVALAIAAQPGDGLRSRYSLLLQGPAMHDEAALYEFVRAATPVDARFVVPPDMDYFRFEAGRAVVVDFKGVPMNSAGLLEWYRRIEDVSGVRHPATMTAAGNGYHTIDTGRLDMLRCRYGVSFAVLRSVQTAPDSAIGSGWQTVYRNSSWQVLRPRQALPCPSPKSATPR